MENGKEFELIVSQGKRPIWMTLISALFFTLMFYSIYQLIIMIWNHGFSNKISKPIINSIGSISYCLSGGIAFSITKTVLIDVDRDKLISRYFVGPFSKNISSVVPELEYISLFLDAREKYQVNLWYKGNRHYKMYDFEDKKPAMEFALNAANKLGIELLDATEKGNSKWIEIV